MRGIPARLAVLALVVAGCTTAGTPATTPPSTTSAASTVAATTTLPSATTTTTTQTTTTTADRVAEIEAIFQDLEERRLRALYEGDKEAFKTLFANEEYMQRSLVLFDLVEFVGRPQPGRVDLLEVLYDGNDCLAATLETGYQGVLAEGVTATKVVVVERVEGGWGISYVGEGWACEGPHPFSP